MFELERVSMADHADCYLAQLSVGSGTAGIHCPVLAIDPCVMLFDEPTSALNSELKREMN